MKKDKKLALAMTALIAAGSLSGCMEEPVEPTPSLYGPPQSEELEADEHELYLEEEPVEPTPPLYGPPQSEELEADGFGGRL